jgi:hypothetical protein
LEARLPNKEYEFSENAQKGLQDMGDCVRFYDDINDNAPAFSVFSLLEIVLKYDKAENLDAIGYCGSNCFGRLGGFCFIKTNQ